MVKTRRVSCFEEKLERFVEVPSGLEINYPAAVAMNKDELREVTSQLEALEALAKLFKNLWYERLRQSS